MTGLGKSEREEKKTQRFKHGQGMLCSQPYQLGGAFWVFSSSSCSRSRLATRGWKRMRSCSRTRTSSVGRPRAAFCVVVAMVVLVSGEDNGEYESDMH
ncbi:hypothetical protein M011DRAFT_299736 [Sporormia fimetaria CBS 119925]|uniref:Uncharacterized protein n=1 Tax=Sporormia fimetaria CBS 119925 TaxID=1340428 RepID=A0A6A6UVV1_9PLEO|nr:hypothetical protein M011DRAFT_299736 [Sporormia fimetaria CBS 119925]